VGFFLLSARLQVIFFAETPNAGASVAINTISLLPHPFYPLKWQIMLLPIYPVDESVSPMDEGALTLIL
jgi:hypothetical protein